MVVQIASDIGIDAADLLQGEVDALGKRLENVRESITALADIAEARAENEQDCNRNITEAKAYLNDVQQVCYYILFIMLKACMLSHFTLFYSVIGLITSCINLTAQFV